MEELRIEDIYKIDRDQLLNYYNRIKNQFKDLSPAQSISKFLINQSVGKSDENVLNILNYYENKIIEGKNILDLAFEWIRGQKIRLEYMKYLIRAQFSKFELAIDECIYLFFLKYDKYVRNLLKKDIQEHEISTLYEIFFKPYESQTLKIEDILIKYNDKVPTVIQENKKINTNLITLHSTLSSIIMDDYKRVLSSRKEEQQSKEFSAKKSQTFKKGEINEFNGTNIERILKVYSFNKKEPSVKVIESGAAGFLSSFFRFGTFYDYENFKDILVQSLSEYLILGMNDKNKESNPPETIKSIISQALSEFRTVHKIKTLDGVAWLNDLKPVIKSIIKEIMNNLFKSKEGLITEKEEEKVKEKLSSNKPIVGEKTHGKVDFSKIFDVDLEIEEYREKLDVLLNTSNVSMIEKRNIIRKKVQEFKMAKRRSLIK